MSIFKKQAALSTGARGEKAAIKYLQKNGYKILDSNFFNTSGRRLGEIDIVAKEDEELVFIEVKTRTLSGFGNPLPEESITRAKLYKLNKAASFYISKNGFFNVPYRFDAITLVAEKGQDKAVLKHIKNIFL